MSFINERLPEEVEINALREETEPGAEIIVTDGGFEVSNNRHAQNTLRYELRYPAEDYHGTNALAIKRIWRASRGTIGFRFRDWDPDMSELTNEVIGTGDGSTTAFQITKTWTADGLSQVRTITRPVSSLTVKKDGVTVGAGYSINYATGVLTFSVAPANGVEVSVTGLFDIPVRFESAFSATGMASFLEHIETLTLIELKE